LPSARYRPNSEDSPRPRANSAPVENRWTTKEVIGHLIDSASNNHQRFARGRITAGQAFSYNDHEWEVRLHDDLAARWHDVIDLRRAYDTHLLHGAGCMSGEWQWR